jgi:hypothetical protein
MATPMDPVQVNLTRIFDVQRVPNTRFTAKHTRFGFEAEGLTKYFVRVPGWPRIEVGDKLIVLLRRHSDWQSVAGWRNLTTGELIHEDVSRLAVNFFVGAIAAIAFWYPLLDDVPGHPLWSPFWATAFTGVALLLAQSLRRALTARQRLNDLSASQ